MEKEDLVGLAKGLALKAEKLTNESTLSPLDTFRLRNEIKAAAKKIAVEVDGPEQSMKGITRGVRLYPAPSIHPYDAPNHQKAQLTLYLCSVHHQHRIKDLHRSLLGKVAGTKRTSVDPGSCQCQRM